MVLKIFKNLCSRTKYVGEIKITTTEGQSTILTEYERELVDLFGNLFFLHGRPQNFGILFALLSLKATSPERGLDQEEIASLTNKSVSTISRTLDKMVSLKYCSFKEDKGEISSSTRRKYYPRRRYYMRASYKDISKDTVTQGIVAYEGMKEKVEQIRQKIPEEEYGENTDLLALLDRFRKDFDQLVTVYQKMIELWAEITKEESP